VLHERSSVTEDRQANQRTDDHQRKQPPSRTILRKIMADSQDGFEMTRFKSKASELMFSGFSFFGERLIFNAVL
jgi:hypothetical protein